MTGTTGIVSKGKAPAPRAVPDILKLWDCSRLQSEITSNTCNLTTLFQLQHIYSVALIGVHLLVVDLLCA